MPFSFEEIKGAKTMTQKISIETLEYILFDKFDDALTNYYVFRDFEILKDVKIEIFKDYKIDLTVTQLYKTMIKLNQAYYDCDIEKLDNLYNELNLTSI